ncbi:hypothetical protein I305_03464 [Cryptococcus gattii E566]|uniref:Uncharacterized protein n=2 Tax=Cryptococcus gattii TaxID=37769 RepID=E6R5F8_CRYGW|nr:Hypothetical protein CGB_D1150W [Cryptococcus gattii WM276]ADV21524.1 Hypothetical protein CGB_D1150W [Cryptococcus gattii WM276]KIR81142.1 hypothetical protein I306_01856 [Cryptococcus gattii EJB2]KIY34110.1 hypothetical protein I305_03464 [Cryptococcus gattii E566]
MQLSATNNDASEKITSDDIDGFQVVTQVVTEKSATPATETDTLSSETRRSDKDGTPDTIIESVMKLRISSPEFKDNHGRGCPHRRDFHCHHKHFYGPRGFMGPPPGFMPFGFDRLVPPEFAVGRGFSKHYKHGKHGNKFAKGISGAGHKHRHHRAYSPPFFEEFKTDSGPECHKKRMKAFFGPHGHHGVHHDRRHHKHASDDEVAAHEPTEKQLTSESNSASLSASDFETDSAATICGDEEKCARLWASHGFRIPGDRGFGGRGLGMAHHRGMKGLGHGKRRYMGPMGMDMGAIPDRGFDNEYTPHSPPFVPESEMSKGMRGRHFPRNFGRSGGRGGKHGCSFDPMGGMGPNAFFGQDEYPKHMPMHDRYHGSPPPPPEFMPNEQGSSAPLRPHPTAFLRHPASFRPHPNHFGRYHAHHGRRGFGGRFAEFGYETSGASPAPTAATT